MGIEVRLINTGWEHPKNKSGEYIPLFNNFVSAVKLWDLENYKWEKGMYPPYADDKSKTLPYSEWNGPRPIETAYLPSIKE